MLYYAILFYTYSFRSFHDNSLGSFTHSSSFTSSATLLQCLIEDFTYVQSVWKWEKKTWVSSGLFLFSYSFGLKQNHFLLLFLFCRWILTSFQNMPFFNLSLLVGLSKGSVIRPNTPLNCCCIWICEDVQEDFSNISGHWLRLDYNWMLITPTQPLLLLLLRLLVFVLMGICCM